MSLPNQVSMGGGGGADVGLLFRLTDQWLLGGGAASASSFVFHNGGGIRVGGASVLWAGSLGVPTQTWGDGGQEIRYVGAAGQQMSQSNELVIDFSARPASGPEPRRYLRYVMEYNYSKSASVVGQSKHGFNTIAEIDTSVNCLGLELQSYAGLNGGAWTIVSRLAQGGPLVVALNTGVPAVGHHRWRWEYSDGPEPTLQVSCDGTLVGTLTGAANFPAYVGHVTGETYPRFRAGTGAGAGGTTDYLSRALYEIWKGDGWQ